MVPGSKILNTILKEKAFHEDNWLSKDTGLPICADVEDYVSGLNELVHEAFAGLPESEYQLKSLDSIKKIAVLAWMCLEENGLVESLDN